MTQSLSDKMHLLASHVNDLNAAGKVKAMSKNEKGYAKVFAINSGCRVWIHHDLNDRIVLDLMVTKSGRLTSPDAVNFAVTKFSQFTKDAGYELSHLVWKHAINKTDIRDQYYFDVSNRTVETIIELIEKLKATFGQPTRS